MAKYIDMEACVTVSLATAIMENTASEKEKKAEDKKNGLSNNTGS